MSDAPKDLTVREVGRNLEIEAFGETFVIPPVPARVGAPMHAQLLGMSFGTMELTGEEQENMFRTAMSSEVFDHCYDTLRLDQMTPLSTIALYWNTVGMEAVEAFIAGGVKKALEVIMSRLGLDLPTSRSLAAAVTTPVPGSTSVTGIRNGGETKSADAQP